MYTQDLPTSWILVTFLAQEHHPHIDTCKDVMQAAHKPIGW